MTDANQTAAARAAGGTSSRRLVLSWKLMLLLAAALAALSSGAVYWYLRARPAPTAVVERAPELPFYLELKPFVISIVNSAGIPHFVQLGLNLALSGKDAGGAVGAILPEIQDTLRQTVLGFKVEDIVTPAGVDKLREAMIADINRLLLRRLGAAEVKRLSAESPNGKVVANVYFSTLIVE
jgi:flagellar basal body-associated protein FliL